MLWWPLPGSHPPAQAGGEWRRLADFAYAAASAYAFYGVFALLAALARDPSLGIRRVSRRLALSHVLVVAVPVVLIACLWVAGTVLGVSTERATVAARQVDTDGRTLHDELAAALREPDPPARLARWADDTATRWPGMTVWLASDSLLERVRGASTLDAALLRAWLADSSLESYAALAGADSLYLGALARSGAGDVGGIPRGGAHAAIALVPMSAYLAGAPTSITRARLQLIAGAVQAGNGAVAIGPGPPPRSAPPHHGLTLSTGGSQFTMRGAFWPVMTSGFALVEGLAWRHDRWEPQRQLLMAGVAPGDALLGLIRGMRDNPISAWPLVLLTTLALLFLLVVAFDLFMVRNMGRSITTAIRALRIGAGRLEAGELGFRIPVGGDDDLWEVAEAFNVASSELERAREIEQERNRLENELSVARQIQARLLPGEPPAVPGLEIAGLTRPATQVGGDYFDHVDLGDGRALVVIADVSGHGVPAALLMSGFRASLLGQELATIEGARLASRLNDFVVRSVEPGKFITAFLAFADPLESTLVYVNAGHNPPLLLRGSGACEELTAGGPILGVVSGFAFATGTTAFEPGDVLLLYTDGVTEGMNAADELWGDERLAESLRRHQRAPCRTLIESITADLRAFEAGRRPADDVTLLATRRTREGPAASAPGS